MMVIGFFKSDFHIFSAMHGTAFTRQLFRDLIFHFTNKTDIACLMDQTSFFPHENLSFFTL